MDPLSVVEQYLGAVETWPTTVIMNMMVENPTAPSVCAISAFMYGNRVPLSEAIRCFQACNGGRSRYVNKKMHEWYCIFDRNPYRRHKAQYYNIQLKAMVWLNGKACKQDELVYGGLPLVPECGMEGTGCECLIRVAIGNVREGRGNERPDPTCVFQSNKTAD